MALGSAVPHLKRNFRSPWIPLRVPSMDLRPRKLKLFL